MSDHVFPPMPTIPPDASPEARSIGKALEKSFELATRSNEPNPHATEELFPVERESLDQTIVTQELSAQQQPVFNVTQTFNDEDPDRVSRVVAESIKEATPIDRRPSWPDYFIEMTHVIAKRSTCDRKHVGALLIDPTSNSVLATGYNGSLPDAPHCNEVDHDMHNGHCVRTVHAEVNALAQCARHGIKTAGAHAYVNTFPCWPCFKALASAGIGSIVYDDTYREDKRVREAAMWMGIPLVQYKKET